VLAGLALMTALGAFSQEPVTVEGLVLQLSSDSFVDRELAADELEYNEKFSLSNLEAQLKRTDLNEEQRLRLFRAAMIRFVTEPRAAMGIQLSSEINELGLRITGTVEGFDSINFLQNGDFISEINGWPIRAGVDLQVAIISRSPGEVVPVVYVRNEQRLTADIELGAWASLEGNNSLQRSALQAAWTHRSRDYSMLGMPDVINYDAQSVEAWETAANKPWTGPTARRNTDGTRLRQMVVVGGEARPRPGALAGVTLDRPLSRSARGRANDFPPMLRQHLTKAEVEIIAMQERIRRSQLQLEIYQRNGAQRRQIDQVTSQLESYQMALAELQRKADRLRSELDGLGIQKP
jgi:hypothetical protein